MLWCASSCCTSVDLNSPGASEIRWVGGGEVCWTHLRSTCGNSSRVDTANGIRSPAWDENRKNPVAPDAALGDIET
jgi:hypothetical protein